jgi:S1-C subfamily serine protease
VLYATAEDGSSGVRVLDVIAGSPAARAGFSSQFSTRTEKVLQAGIILLALTPVGPFAILLASALHPSYNQAPRRDLIVAVDGQLVSNAQEFNDVMRRFGPGDTVTFVVERGTSHVHLSAQLEAEPQRLWTDSHDTAL